MEADVRKFFNKSDKGYLTTKDIKQRLLVEYHNLYEAFLLQTADALSSHYSYNHKIELVLGSKIQFL
jgi:hypothetical protein